MRQQKILQQRSPSHEQKRFLQSLGQIYRLLQWIKNPFQNRITEMQNSEQQNIKPHFYQQMLNKQVTG